MHELKAKEYNGVRVIDSREVATMVERSHDALLKSIRIYISYLRDGEIDESKFFIETTYTNAQNHEMPCYLITKKGCDMIANKMTGKKGVLFTAAYVTAFESMHGYITNQAKIPPTTSPAGVASLISIYRRIMRDQGCSPTDISIMARNIGLAYGVPLPDKFVKELPGQVPGQLTFLNSAN